MGVVLLKQTLDVMRNIGNQVTRHAARISNVANRVLATFARASETAPIDQYHHCITLKDIITYPSELHPNLVGSITLAEEYLSVPIPDRLRPHFVDRSEFCVPKRLDRNKRMLSDIKYQMDQIGMRDAFDTSPPLPVTNSDEEMAQLRRSLHLIIRNLENV